MTEYNIYNSIKEKYNENNSTARKISKEDFKKFVDLIKTPDDAQIKNFVENVLKKIDSEMLKSLLEGLPDDDGENSLKKMFENIIRNYTKFKNLYYFSNYTFIKVIDEVVLLNKKNTDFILKYINDISATTDAALKSSSSNASNISTKLSAKDKEIEELKKQLTIERTYVANLKASFGKIKTTLGTLNTELESDNTLKETVNIVRNNIKEAELLSETFNTSEENSAATSGGACNIGGCGNGKCKKCNCIKRKKRIVKNKVCN